MTIIITIILYNCLMLQMSKLYLGQLPDSLLVLGYTV